MASKIRIILSLPKNNTWIISHLWDKEYLFPPYPTYSLNNITYVGLVWTPWDLMCIGACESQRNILSPKNLTFLLELWPIVCELSIMCKNLN